jgi:hypothetical protein
MIFLAYTTFSYIGGRQRRPSIYENRVGLQNVSDAAGNEFQMQNSQAQLPLQWGSAASPTVTCWWQAEAEAEAAIIISSNGNSRSKQQHGLLMVA